MDQLSWGDGGDGSADDDMAQMPALAGDHSGSDSGDNGAELDTDDDSLDEDSDSWVWPETIAGVKRGARRPPPKPPPVVPTPGPAVGFHPAPAFVGRVNGFVFTTRNALTGYYRDADQSAATRTPIVIAQLVDNPEAVGFDAEVRPPAHHARRPDGG